MWLSVLDITEDQTFQNFTFNKCPKFVCFFCNISSVPKFMNTHKNIPVNA